MLWGTTTHASPSRLEPYPGERNIPWRRRRKSHGRRTSAGSIKKATNPRKNEQVEDSIPWFDRDKDGILLLKPDIRRGWAGPN